MLTRRPHTPYHVVDNSWWSKASAGFNKKRPPTAFIPGNPVWWRGKQRAILPHVLEIAEIRQQRIVDGQLRALQAARGHTSLVEMEIKSVAPKVLNVERYISERAKLWKSSQIRSFFPLEHTPGVVSLLAGKPNPETFPIEAITLTVKSPIPDELTYDIKIEGQDLERALQYGITGGLPDFVQVGSLRGPAYILVT